MNHEISICRKREHLYIKLQGNFNQTSSDELMHAVRNLLNASLQISSPDERVTFTFTTHAKVVLPKGTND